MRTVQLLLDGVGDVYVVQPFIFQPDITDPHHPRRDAYGGAVRIDGVEQHGVGGDLAVIPHPYRAQHLGTAPHHDITPQRGVTLAGILAGAAQRDTLIQRAAVAYLGGFADDDAGAVIDKDAVSQRGAGVDLDAGEKAGELADEPCKEKAAVPVQPVRRPVPEQRMYPGVNQQDLDAGTGSGVTLAHRRNIFPNACEHISDLPCGWVYSL